MNSVKPAAVDASDRPTGGASPREVMIVNRPNVTAMEYIGVRTPSIHINPTASARPHITDASGQGCPRQYQRAWFREAPR